MGAIERHHRGFGVGAGLAFFAWVAGCGQVASDSNEGSGGTVTATVGGRASIAGGHGPAARASAGGFQPTGGGGAQGGAEVWGGGAEVPPLGGSAGGDDAKGTAGAPGGSGFGDDGVGGALEPFCGITSGMARVDCGDVNHDWVVNIIDAQQLAAHLVDPDVSIWTNAADVNCDGSLTQDDAQMIADYHVGLISAFPCAPRP